MNKLYNHIAPIPLFICTLSCLPALLFQQNLAFLWINVLLFLILSSIKKGQLRIMPPIIIFLSIIFFSILTPNGRVLFSIGTLRVTEDALLRALEKSGILLGMVFVSQYAVSRSLQLPGNIGKFISHMFLFFDTFSEGKKTFNVKTPFQSIDERLLAVYTQDETYNTHKTPIHYSPFSWIICILPILIVYTLLFINRFFPTLAQ